MMFIDPKRGFRLHPRRFWRVPKPSLWMSLNPISMLSATSVWSGWEDNVKRHRVLLKRVRIRVSGGKNTEGDLVQTQERLQAAVALVSEIKARKEVAAAKFKNAVGVAPSQLQRVRAANQPYKSTESAMSTAIANNPRLAALKHEIDAAGYTTEQSRSSLYPLITLEGSASRGEDLDGTAGRSDDFRAGVVLRWKLFDGGVRSRRIDELTEREYVKVSEYDAFVRDLGEGIENAWTRIYEGRRQVDAKREQLRLMEKVVANYQLEYEADKRSILDLLNAENSRFSIEFDLSNATSISQFSSYQLLGQTGNLLKSLGVAKPEGSDVGPNPDSAFSSSNAFKSFTIPTLRQD